MATSKVWVGTLRSNPHSLLIVINLEWTVAHATSFTVNLIMTTQNRNGTTALISIVSAAWDWRETLQNSSMVWQRQMIVCLAVFVMPIILVCVFLKYWNRLLLAQPVSSAGTILSVRLICLSAHKKWVFYLLTVLQSLINGPWGWILKWTAWEIAQGHCAISHGTGLCP